jgi:hypothetical protein
MEDRSKEKHREYCKARNKVKRLTRRDRKEREKQEAESAKMNSKNFWKFVNSKRKTKTGVSELHDKSESCTFIASSDGDKAENLAIFFSSVFTDEDVNYLPKMEKRNSDIATDEPFSQEEIKKLLLGLNTTKSPGPDIAHPKVLYQLANVIDKLLFIIFKKSFETGIVPEK